MSPGGIIMAGALAGLQCRIEAFLEDDSQNVYLLPNDQVFVESDSPTFTAID